MTCVLLLYAGSTQAWDQSDNCCYDPCVSNDLCASFDPCCCIEDTWYIGGFGGANWLTGGKTHRGCFIDSKLNYETGFVAAASIGRRFVCNDLRVEFEYSYRRNEFKNRISCDFCAPRKGRVWSNSYLVNGFWYIPMCNDMWVKPFVGGGVGYATQRFEFRNHTCSCDSRKKRNTNGFAWQVIAGLEHSFCNTDISLEYRFFDGRLKNVYNHTLGLGLRYNF